MGAPPWPFRLVDEGVAVGDDAPDGWVPVAGCSPLILVGVTGVGKSTALVALQRRHPGVAILPDRRLLTDRWIIPLVWDAATRGRPPDRLERLACTRKFREQNHGGMAAVLRRLWFDPGRLDEKNLVFDGLRGGDEVAFAIANLPRARFAALQAREMVRLLRLLGRDDRFDTVMVPTVARDQWASTGDVAGRFAELGGMAAAALFNEAEQAALLAMIAAGEFTTEAVRAKLAIVVEERRNYDPDAACAILRARASERTVIIDTEYSAADEVAAAMLDLDGWRAERTVLASARLASPATPSAGK